MYFVLVFFSGVRCSRSEGGYQVQQPDRMAVGPCQAKLSCLGLRLQVVNTDMAYVSAYATGDYGAVYNYPLYFVLKDGLGSLPSATIEEVLAVRTSLFLDQSRSQCLLWAIGLSSSRPRPRPAFRSTPIHEVYAIEEFACMYI